MKSHEIAKLRAWSCVELGLSRSEFDQLTPAEFFERFSFWQRKERRVRADTARLCYVIAASAGARAPDGSPLTPGYFLSETPVTAKGQPRAKKEKPLTGKQLEAQFIAALPAEWRPKN